MLLLLCAGILPFDFLKILTVVVIVTIFSFAGHHGLTVFFQVELKYKRLNLFAVRKYQA